MTVMITLYGSFLVVHMSSATHGTWPHLLLLSESCTNIIYFAVHNSSSRSFPRLRFSRPALCLWWFSLH